MPYSVELAEIIRRILPSLSLKPDEMISEKKMFGGLCFTLNGKMLIGINKESIVVRLSDEDYERELAAGRVFPMDLTGKPLRNFAYLAQGTFGGDSEVLAWANLSATFVRDNMLGETNKSRKKR